MMAYAEYLAGIAFNNASLGYVHAMAHQLGGFYNLPHGVCNAILLPVVMEYNAKAVPELFIDIAVVRTCGACIHVGASFVLYVPQNQKHQLIIFIPQAFGFNDVGEDSQLAIKKVLAEVGTLGFVGLMLAAPAWCFSNCTVPLLFTRRCAPCPPLSASPRTCRPCPAAW